MKTRNALIDAGKGIGILFVVLGHALQRNVPDYDTNFLFRIIYTFHMPLFIFLSGYVSKYGEVKTIKKNFFRLLIPFFAWYLIYLIEFSFDVKHFPNPTHNILFLKNPYHILWFLWILFFCHVGFYLMSKVQKWTTIYGAILVFLIIEILPIPALYLLQFNFMFFVGGYIVSYYKDTFKKQWKLVLAIAILTYILLFPYWEMSNTDHLRIFVSNNAKVLESHIRFVNMVYKQIIGFSGIVIVLCGLHFLIKIAALKNILIKLGFYSFDIFVAHQLLLISGVSSKITVNVILWFIMALAGSLLLSFVLKKNKFLKRILYGVV
jgi:fucose 4-O-acetylase-like acetyltransferase